MIKTYTCEDAQTVEEYLNAMKIAKNAKLYVKGWQLQYILSDTTFIKTAFADGAVINDVMAIAYSDNQTPIGVAVISYGDIQIFVKARNRKKGLGTKLVSAVKEKYAKDTITAHYGIEGSEFFWKNQQGIKYSEY